MLIGLISTDDLIGVIQTLNENATNEDVQEMMNEVDHGNEQGTIDFDEFLSIMSKRMKVSVPLCCYKFIMPICYTNDLRELTG